MARHARRSRDVSELNGRQRPNPEPAQALLPWLATFVVGGLGFICGAILLRDGWGLFRSSAVVVGLVALGLIVRNVRLRAYPKLLIRSIAVLIAVALGLFFIPLLSQESIAGTVTCKDGLSIIAVWVKASSGASGWASIARTSQSSTRYAYTLENGGTYSLHVGCGGWWHNWKYSPTTPFLSGTGHSFLCRATKLSLEGDPTGKHSCVEV